MTGNFRSGLQLRGIMLALSLLQIYILQKNLHKQKATNTKILE